jgi:hypothetical protein
MDGVQPPNAERAARLEVKVACPLEGVLLGSFADIVASTEYPARQQTRLSLEWLPGDAPELNAGEYLWGNLGGSESGNPCAADLVNVGGRYAPGWPGFAATENSPSHS